jgi:hypothetical protein
MSSLKYRFLLAVIISLIVFSFSACNEDEPIDEPSEGPIAHYKLDGNANDDINDYDGVSTSMVTWQAREYRVPPDISVVMSQ